MESLIVIYLLTGFIYGIVISEDLIRADIGITKLELLKQFLLIIILWLPLLIIGVLSNID